MAKKKKGKKKKGAAKKAAVSKPFPSFREMERSEFKNLLRVAEDRNDYICVQVRIANWKFASFDLLMRISETLEAVQAQVEARHGSFKNFRLFLDKGLRNNPTPGVEETDLTKTLADCGFQGAGLNPERPYPTAANATTKGYLHCEFEPVVESTLLDVDSGVVVDGKLLCSLDAKARAATQAKPVGESKAK